MDERRIQLCGDQVMRLGGPVTAVTLSPAMDLLATAHAGQRGIFLWSNQRMFGFGAEVCSPGPLKTWEQVLFL